MFQEASSYINIRFNFIKVLAKQFSILYQIQNAELAEPVVQYERMTGSNGQLR